MNNSSEIKKLEKNIISWYPFKYDSKMLCINVMSENIIDYLKNKIKTIREIDRIDGESTQDEKYDYILVYGINKETCQLSECINYSKNHLNYGGIILLVCDNKNGLQFYNANFDKGVKEKKYSKQEIESELKECSFFNYKFYYPLPNYRSANVIFTDKNLPDEESINRDLTLYEENEIVVFDEREKYKEIIEENNELFSVFANSYLIELSEVENEIKYISFNNSRKEQYRVKTIMKDKEVYKKPYSEEAYKHFERIEDNIDILNKLGLNILDKFEDEKIISKIMPSDKQLDKIIINSNYEDSINIIHKFKEELMTKLPIEENNNDNVFNKYKINVSDELNNNLNYTKYGLYDLIFQNCFYIDNEFYFYDQEWIEDNIPIEFIIYRAIEYLGNTSSKVKKEQLFKELEIDNYIVLFNELENYIQNEIKNNTIWTIHSQNGISMHDLYYTKVHYENLYNLSKNENEQLIKHIENIEKCNEELEKRNFQLFNELNGIKNSKSWKILHRINKLKYKK